MPASHPVPRTFLGLEAVAPWPESLPKGRVLSENARHATLLFFGNREIETSTIPPPPFRLGPVGIFSKLLFLPPHKKRVVAWHVEFLANVEEIFTYQKILSNQYDLDKRKWLPHVTMARSPFDPKKWKNEFTPLPVVFPAVHLYESKGDLHYEKIWSHQLIFPFEKIPHTADIVFKVRGTTLQEIYIHSLTAIAFEFPNLLEFTEKREFSNINEIIPTLGKAIARGDAEYGSPIKAVSDHGDIVEMENGLLEWEMIIDV